VDLRIDEVRGVSEVESAEVRERWSTQILKGKICRLRGF
jgi:hypothetical protein